MALVPQKNKQMKWTNWFWQNNLDHRVTTVRVACIRKYAREDAWSLYLQIFIKCHRGSSALR